MTIIEQRRTLPQTVLNGLRSLVSRPAHIVSELIGRGASVVSFWQPHRFSNSLDNFRPDYAFWDRLRRGKATGFEIGGLFAKPIAEILSSYTIGLPPTITLVASGDPVTDTTATAHTDMVLERLIQHYHALMLNFTEDKYALGDQFVFVNPDSSWSIPSPDTVKIDWIPGTREMERITVFTSDQGVSIEDSYTADTRTLSTRSGGTEPVVQTFANLLGRIPVAHFANNRSGNERFGRPIYEALYRIFSRYDDLMEKALDGTEIVSNPIPTFEGMENVQETIDANSTPTGETYTDPFGSVVQRVEVAFDRLAAVFVGKGGKFDFKSPPIGFTKDITGMLNLLFLLICDVTRIPEFLYGGAVAQSKASTDSQMPPFVAYIQSLQVQLAGQGADDLLDFQAHGGLHELFDLTLRARKLVDPQVVVAPVQIQWPDLTSEDAQVRLQKVIYQRSQGALARYDMAKQLRLTPNPKQTVDLGQAETKAETPVGTDPNAPTETAYQAALNAAGHQQMNPVPAENPAGGAPGSTTLAPPSNGNGRGRGRNQTRPEKVTG